jgi:nucleoside-diphosphate-sugar epimerase
MKILLTGGAGYIGSVVCKKLLDEGHKVHVYDKLLFGGESLIYFLYNPNFLFTKADIRDKKSLTNSLGRIDAVVHMAAIVGEHACNPHPKIAKEINAV